jgi:drug/metabolite transporter (DMT)-like permease
VAIGFAPIFVRLSEVGPSATAFWRITLALPALLLWAGLEKRGSAGSKNGWPLLAAAGLFFAADLAIWHWSIKFTLVANATLEANLASVFVTLFAWWFFGQKASRWFLAAMALSIFGTGLLVTKNAQVSHESLFGDALGVSTAIFYAGYLLTVKVARDRGHATSRIMAVSGVVTALVLLPVAYFSGEKLLPVSAHGWLNLVALALISHLGGQSLIAYALAGLPAQFASVALLVQPATAAVAAWLILGESLGPLQMLGGLILLGGIFLARQNSAPQKN